MRVIVMTEIKIKSESGSHWYYRDGTPCYEIEKKTKPGEFRAVNLQWDRKLNLVPSVTTVQKIKANSAIERWKQSKLAEVAVTFPINGRQPSEVVPLILDEWREEMGRAADAGSHYHAEIEKVIALDDFVVDLPDKTVLAIGDWMFENLVQAQLIEESFASPLGFGGKIDLIGEWKTTRRPLILDWKTTDTYPDKPISYWPSWCEQLAAYARGINLLDADLVNVVISRTEPGRLEHKQWTEEEIAYGWDGFKKAFELWIHDKKYDPREG